MVLRPNVRASKLIALALRHDPAALGIALDRAGFADVTSLLAGLSAQGVTLTEPELEELVRSSDKQRFAFTADRTRIRANHGHSVDVDLGLIDRKSTRLNSSHLGISYAVFCLK